MEELRFPKFDYYLDESDPDEYGEDLQHIDDGRSLLAACEGEEDR